MGNNVNNNNNKINKSSRPALSPEARENQLISLANDVAERQMKEGTASAQVITHFLRLGSTRERLEQEKIKKDEELIDAKRESLSSVKTTELLYENAITAMREYSGNKSGDDGDAPESDNF